MTAGVLSRELTRVNAGSSSTEARSLLSGSLYARRTPYIILTTGCREQEIRDVFIFVEDDCDLSIKLIDHELDDENQDHTLLGEILLDRGDISDQELNTILASRKKIGEVLVEARMVHPDRIEAALLISQ